MKYLHISKPQYVSNAYNLLTMFHTEKISVLRFSNFQTCYMMMNTPRWIFLRHQTRHKLHIQPRDLRVARSRA